MFSNSFETARYNMIIHVIVFLFYFDPYIFLSVPHVNIIPSLSDISYSMLNTVHYDNISVQFCVTFHDSMNDIFSGENI